MRARICALVHKYVHTHSVKQAQRYPSLASFLAHASSSLPPLPYSPPALADALKVEKEESEVKRGGKREKEEARAEEGGSVWTRIVREVCAPPAHPTPEAAAIFTQVRVPPSFP